MSSLEAEIRQAINRCSRESESNTPDFILAQFLIASLEAFEKASNARVAWFKPADIETP